MTEKKVLFIRHAQCVANVGGEPVISGNSPLTRKGHTQALALAERLRPQPVSSLHASTLERALETAFYVGRAVSMSIIEDPLYVERKFPSALIGRHRNDQETISMYMEWERSFLYPGIDAGDGENFELLRQRAQRMIAQVEQFEDAFPVVITHGFLLRMQTTNTGIFEFSLKYKAKKAEWYVRTWNDHAHLAGIPR
jgi:broad specificity phosphatase PhoE